MRYIDAEKLQERMYHEAFEKDSDLQKWESGCWIRYKLFENCLNEQPTADVVEVVRCKDCKWYGEIGCAIKIVDETALLNLKEKQLDIRKKRKLKRKKEEV